MAWLAAPLAVVGAAVALTGNAAAAHAAASSPAVCARSDYGSSTPPSHAGGNPAKRPVVFVHGWTGRIMTGLGDAVANQLGGDVVPLVFDYSKWSAYWASNDHIAPCLAKYLHAVSAAYLKAGGDGRIIYVAHSMGGIALRYAMSPTTVTDPVTATEVPWVLTLDTPHLGSPWGGLGTAQAKELFANGLGNSVPNPWGVDGGRCLGLHDHGKQLPASCNGLPPWLAGGTTLYQIGGQIAVRRTFLGIHLYDIPLNSDGIVDSSSETGYRTSGPGGTAPVVSSPTTGTTIHTQYVDCQVSTGQLSKSLDAVAGILSSAVSPATMLSDWEALNRIGGGGHDPVTLVMDAAALVAPCSHIHIAADPDAVAQISHNIRNVLKAAQTGPNDSTSLLAYINAGNKVNADDYAYYADGPNQPLRHVEDYISFVRTFVTPSGNIGCSIFADPSEAPGNPNATLCEIHQYTWKNPHPNPSYCGVPIHTSFKANWTGIDGRHSHSYLGGCYGGQPVSVIGRTLPYGSTIIHDGYGCRSGVDYLACAWMATGAGFVVNRTAYHLIQR